MQCCLEIEQGANGVLAHLSAVPADRRSKLMSNPLAQVAVALWTSRELEELGRVAESVGFADDAPRRTAA